ncbi:MAG: serine hydrolase domain-containing protein [Acidimicrobiales bacterium]
MRRTNGRWSKIAAVVAGLGLLVGCSDEGSPPPSTTSTAAPSSAGVPAAVESPLREAVESYGAPGGIAMLRHGNERWGVAVGASVDGGDPASPDMTFRIGSITKPIVAILVLDAVDRGLVGLDDEVDDLVPGAIRPDPPVTVRMLLDHTSGIANTDDLDPASDGARLSDPDLVAEFQRFGAAYLDGEPVVASDGLLVGLAETHDRYFAPGAGFHYSNTNYQLAAMVLEAATGRSLADLIDERIAEPLGLEHVWLAPADPTPPDLHGHALDGAGELVDVTDDLSTFGNGGSGGVVADAADLLSLLQALASGRLLPAALVAEMERPTPQSDRSYGLGLVTYRFACGTFVGHEGAVNGTASIALTDEQGEDGVVIVLDRYDEPGPDLAAVAEQVVCSIPGA